MNFTATSKDELLGLVSDMHKDVYGFRPRGMYSDYTEAQLSDVIDELQIQLNEQIDWDKKREEKAIADFKALIQKTIDMGAGDEETALKWLVEGSECNYDFEYFVWLQGFSVYTEYGREIADKLEKIFSN